jgi:hypothetical protein
MIMTNSHNPYPGRTRADPGPDLFAIGQTKTWLLELEHGSSDGLKNDGCAKYIITILAWLT